MRSEVKYSLPFDTRINPIRISQGSNGPWSHFGNRINAVDFALPIGTPVIAARSGKIYQFKDDGDLFYEGLDTAIGDELYMRSATNMLKILHEETREGKIISMYSHLEKGSVTRKPFIKAGEVIACTGKSGWIGEVPHLHFEVHRLNNMPPQLTSLEVTFSNYFGSLDHEILLIEDKIYFGN